MTLGEAIKKDLEDTILSVPKQVLTDIGREYKQHIWKVSEEGQPDGSGRQVLNTKYAQRKINNSRKGFRDFIWTGTARKSFYFEQGENTIGFGYDNGEVYSYMNNHKNKGEGHRLYPIEKDSKSSEQKSIIDFVENQISNTLNKPRTLKAEAKVTRLG